MQFRGALAAEATPRARSGSSRAEEPTECRMAQTVQTTEGGGLAAIPSVGTGSRCRNVAARMSEDAGRNGPQRPHAYQAQLCVAIFSVNAQDKAKSVVCAIVPGLPKEPDTY